MTTTLITQDDLSYARPKPKDWDGEDYIWCQEKHDGWRVTVFVPEKGKIRAIPRKQDLNIWPAMSRIPGMVEAVERFRWPTVVDGELHSVNGLPATSVPTLLRDDPGGLRFSPFAFPLVRGAYLPDLEAATADAKGLLGDLDGGAIWVRNPITRERVFEMMGEQTERELLLSTAASHDLEGWVLKKAHLDGWYRIKRTHTIDVVCMDTVAGKGKWTGLLGSVVVGLHDDEGVLRKVGTVGGWSEEERIDLTDDDVLGRVLEVEFQSVTEAGQMQFARRIRFRDDKAAEECHEEGWTWAEG